MAQGEMKKNSTFAAKKQRQTKKAKNPKKGARFCAPKRPAAVKDHLVNKAFTKALNVKNEKMFAGVAKQQSDKLTIMKALSEAGAKELDKKKR
ncbi:leydig cell tumor protein [Schizosaccharomyces japonicus yFS275]|uniref:Leydig cell tumor protein n=1 Tax=Schizosaccharomyces japonicus (strain yFS275 / FY16936) TaxID=402676 RepID=B6K667_SCHJY|nr:leydig cell tumor protein [Schizosaccharomyces japonicus yFS275]EEB09021.1 leydig cell tumor protein [Schizosaccharomyces japonicus yFS275]